MDRSRRLDGDGLADGGVTPIAAGAATSERSSESFQRFWSLRDVSWIWLFTRVFTIGSAALLSAWSGQKVTRTWQQWDAGWFLHVAQHGYGDDAQSPAFYPLYPFLLRVVGELLDGRYALAAFVLSLPLTLCAFVLLHRLASDHVDEASSLRAVWYLALFPYAFFLQAFYSETAFIVLAIGAFLAAERGRFGWAGTLAGAAMLTRPMAPAVLAGLVVVGLRSKTPRAALARLAIAPVTFLLFPLVLVSNGRSPLAFVSAEHHWRQATPLSAFYGIGRGARQAWESLRALMPFTPGGPNLAVVTFGAFAALVLFAVLSFVAWRQLGAPYGIYCALSLAVPVVATTSPWPLVSMQRFVLTLFPCFVVLGSLPIPRSAHRLLLGLSGAAMVGVLYYWTRGSFIA